MTETQPTTHESGKSESAAPDEQHRTQRTIDHILDRLSPLELPAKKEFENYLRHKLTPEPQAQHARELLYCNHALPRLLPKVGQA